MKKCDLHRMDYVVFCSGIRLRTNTVSHARYIMVGSLYCVTLISNGLATVLRIRKLMPVILILSTHPLHSNFLVPTSNYFSVIKNLFLGHVDTETANEKPM